MALRKYPRLITHDRLHVCVSVHYMLFVHSILERLESLYFREVIPIRPTQDKRSKVKVTGNQNVKIAIRACLRQKWIDLSQTKQDHTPRPIFEYNNLSPKMRRLC